MRGLTLRALLCSVALHAILILALAVSVDALRLPVSPPLLPQDRVGPAAVEDTDDVYTGIYIPADRLHSAP